MKILCKIKGHKVDFETLHMANLLHCNRCGLNEHTVTHKEEFSRFGFIPKIRYQYWRFWCRWDDLKSWFKYNIVWKYFHSDKDLPF